MENAKRDRVNNVEFIPVKVEDSFWQITDRPDIVVLDPPRAEAHKRVLERLLELGPDQIIYVSCDLGTLARDLGKLQSGGYRVAKVVGGYVSVDAARGDYNSAICATRF